MQGAETGPLCRERGSTLSTFTVDAAAALAGPDWLQQRRVVAAERLDDVAWPTTDEEVWRYSRIDDFDLDDYGLADGTGQPGTGPTRPGVLDSQPIGRVSTIDGRLSDVSAESSLPDGVQIGRLTDLDDGAELLGSVANEPVDPFVDLNDAFVADPIVVRVPAGAVVREPILVTHLVNRADKALVCPRLVVDLGRGAQATVVEEWISWDQVSLVVPVTELHVGADARLGYTSLQELGPRTWQIAHQVSAVEQQGTLVSAAAALGGDYARLRTDCRLVGRGATGTLLAAYFGEGDQMLDFRTFQDHRAPDTTSSLLFKGAVAGSSRSVYTGLIRVRPNARGTNAFQTNRNVKLSESAWAESVPNLEIENNDVRCSHASAVGPVDEEQRFYLESRGVPPHVAERLVVAGFFDEVLDQLPAPAASAPLRQRIEARLDRRDAA